MGLDRRLRDELHRDASSIDPDTHGRLEAVLQHRGRRARWPSALAGTAVVLLLVAVAGTMLPLGREAVPLQGTTWTLVLEPDDPGVADLGMPGAWTMRLGERATIELTTPTTFSTESRSAPDGYIYTLDGASLTTNLYSHDYGADCAGPATYTWSIDGDGLMLTGDDSCDARAVLLGTRAWTAGPATSR